MHISYEAGILEDPNVSPPDRMWLMTTDDSFASLQIHCILTVSMKYINLSVYFIPKRYKVIKSGNRKIIFLQN